MWYFFKVFFYSNMLPHLNILFALCIEVLCIKLEFNYIKKQNYILLYLLWEIFLYFVRMLRNLIKQKYS